MNKEKIVTAYVEKISKYVNEDELEIIMQAVTILDRLGIKLYTSVMLDSLGEAEDVDGAE